MLDNIKIHVYHHHSWDESHQVMDLLRLILQKLETHMDDVDDELASIKVTLDTINTGVASLLAKIAALPTAGLTPTQKAALDAIKVEAEGIAAAANPPA